MLGDSFLMLLFASSLVPLKLQGLEFMFPLLSCYEHCSKITFLVVSKRCDWICFDYES